MDPPKAKPASSVPATPPTFRLRLRLLIPRELEQERTKAAPYFHFARMDYRILWGTESVTVDFSSAPADVQSKFHGGPVQVPLAYYGTVDPDGLVSGDVADVPNGDHYIELGEYQKDLPSGLTPELWALDQRAPRQHFKPLVRIPLERFDPPPKSVSTMSMQAELWWRLWNLGQIGEYKVAPSFPEHERDSVYKDGPGRVFSAANRIAKAQWNLVRARLASKAPPDTDDALMTDLLRHHDRQGSSR